MSTFAYTLAAGLFATTAALGSQIAVLDVNDASQTVAVAKIDTSPVVEEQFIVAATKSSEEPAGWVQLASLDVDTSDRLQPAALTSIDDVQRAVATLVEDEETTRIVTSVAIVPVPTARPLNRFIPETRKRLTTGSTERPVERTVRRRAPTTTTRQPARVTRVAARTTTRALGSKVKRKGWLIGVFR